MNDTFDFSLDILSTDKPEPQNIHQCKFDEIIPFRIKRHHKLTGSDIAILNSKVKGEYVDLYESYDQRVTSKEVMVDYLKEVKSIIDNYGLKEMNENVQGFQQSIIDEGYDESNIDEHLEDAERDAANAKIDFDEDVDNLFERIYDTDHYHFKHEDAYVWDVSPRLDERRPQILSSVTKEFLGKEYEDYCSKRFHDYMDELKKRHGVREKKADNLVSNIVSGNENDIQKE